MLKISYFYTNIHTKMFALLITCIIDDTYRWGKCRSTKFMTSVSEAAFD